MKEKLDTKQVIKVIKKAKVAIVVTDNDFFLHGNGLEILALYACITHKLSEKFPKEMIRKTFERGLKTKNELIDELVEKLENMSKEDKK